MGRSRSIAASLLGLCWCGEVLADASQSPQEFRSRVEAGEMHSTHERFDVHRPYGLVFADLQRLFDRCFADGHGERGEAGRESDARAFTYHSQVTVLDLGKSQMVLQKSYRVKALPQTEPPGGFYKLLADVERVNASTSSVVTFEVGHRSDDTMAPAIRQWATGSSLICPKPD